MYPKPGEFWWVKVKLTPPLTPMPYQKGEIRLAKVSGPDVNTPTIVRFIDCVQNSYLHMNHVEFIEQVKKPEAP